jgi:hypothetical protein
VQGNLLLRDTATKRRSKSNAFRVLGFVGAEAAELSASSSPGRSSRYPYWRKRWPGDWRRLFVSTRVETAVGKRGSSISLSAA